jgi:hypothetical protein
MEQKVELLLPLCLEADEKESLDQDELLRKALTIIEARLKEKSLK